MKNIFLPHFINKTEIKFTRGLIDILKATHPSSHPHVLKVFMHEDIVKLARKSKNLCWRHLVGSELDVIYNGDRLTIFIK